MLLDIGGLTGIDIGPSPGSDPLPGSSYVDGDQWVIRGGGNDIWGNTDAFHFEYQTWSGDFDAVVRVLSQQYTADWAKAGIMVRADLTPGSIHGMTIGTPRSGSGHLQYRDLAGSWSSHHENGGPNVSQDGSAPVWLRLMRDGNTLYSTWALDVQGVPSAWAVPTEHDSERMPESVNVGLCVDAGNSALVSEVRFDHYSLDPFTALPDLPPAVIVPGPEGGAGYFGIREVINNGSISNQNQATASLLSGTGTVVDYTGQVVNIDDNPPAERAGNDQRFGVVTRGYRSYGYVDQISLAAKGTIDVPTDGHYTFLVNSDDGFRLAVDGRQIGGFEGGRAPEDTFMPVYLTAGKHSLQLTYHEGGGGAEVELLAAPGIKTAYDRTFRLVGDTTPITIPAGVPAGEMPGGFTVREAHPANNQGWNAIADASAFLDSADPARGDLVMDYTSPTVNFKDPESPGYFNLREGEFNVASRSPFALDNRTTQGRIDGDDNAFALRATGTLRIAAEGDYSFGVHSDDGFSLRIAGATWAGLRYYGEGWAGYARLSGDTLMYTAETADTNVIGHIHLAAGDYPVTLDWFEGWGAAFVELSATQGFKQNWDNTFTLLGGTPRPGGPTAGFALVAPFPRVIGHAPQTYVNASTDHLEVTFNTAVDPNEFTPEDVVLTGPLGRVPITNIAPLGSARYALYFNRPLANGAYTLTVGPNVLGLEGAAMDQNFNGVPGEAQDAYSATLLADLTGPQVVGLDPSGDTVGSVGEIQVTFSEPIQQGSFGVSDIVIRRPDGTAMPYWEIGSIQRITDARYRVAFTPQSTLGKYVVEVAPGIIKDLAGNAMDQDSDGVPAETPDDVYSSGFRIVEPTPRVVAQRPADLTRGPLEAIQFDFGRPMDPASFALAEDIVRFSGPEGTIAAADYRWLDDDTLEIMFAPQSVSGNYRITLGPNILDTEGTPMDQDFNGVPGEAQDEYSASIAVDAVCPRVVAHVPVGDISGTVSQIDIMFSEAIQQDSLPYWSVVITRPDGVTLPYWQIRNVTPITDSRYRISFDSQSLYGQYVVQVGPNVSDPAGNLLDQDGNGIGGQPTDVYRAVFNVVNMDLQVQNVAVSSTQLWSGELAQVSWDGFNAFDTQLLGDWLDAVYLSQDDRWDISDIQLTTARHTGGLLPGETYSPAVAVSLPGVLPGDYYLVVRTDVYNQQRETDETNNSVAIGPIAVRVRELEPNGVPVAGALTRADRYDWYAINVTEGEYLRITLDDANNSGWNEVYVRYGQPPTRYHFDYGQEDYYASDRQIQIPDTSAGVYYVLVYGDWVPEASGDFTIKASLVDFSLLEVSANSASNAGRATVKLAGAHFPDAGTIELVAQDGSSIAAAETHFTKTYEAWATFDLLGVAGGLYDVRLKRPDETYATLEDAFTVTNAAGGGGGGRVQSTIIAPGRVRVGWDVTWYIEVSNQGTNDADLPVVWAQLPYGGETLLDVQPAGVPSGVLPPGASRRIPLTFRAPSLPGTVNVGLEIYEAAPSPASEERVTGWFDEELSDPRTKTWNEGKVKFTLDGLPPELLDSANFLFMLPLEEEYGREWSFLMGDTGVTNPSPDFHVRKGVYHHNDGREWHAAGATISIPALSSWIQTYAESYTLTTHFNAGVAVDFVPPKDDKPFYVGQSGFDLQCRLLFNDSPCVPIDTMAEDAVQVKKVSPDSYVVYAIYFEVHPAKWDGVKDQEIEPVTIDNVGWKWGYSVRAEAEPKKEKKGIDVLGSFDPNDLVGPAGFGDLRYLTPDAVMPYTVFFENDPKVANAPAQEVKILNTLDDDLDLSTLELTEIAFADHTIPVPAGLANYETTVDLRPEGINVIVEVKAGLDPETRQVTASFQAIDPDTGWLPEDPRVGFLYPNDATHRGEGHVSYLVRPKADSPTGAQIINRAKIFFDYNDPIDTPQTLNTLDAGDPTSQVDVLPATSESEQFVVTWSGQDDAGGSGIASYDIYVSTDGGQFVGWLDDATDTQATFTGQFGHTYAFYSVARDNVGHEEAAPETPDAVTLLMLNQPPVAVDDIYAVDEDNTLIVPAPGVLGSDTDPNGDLLTAVPVSGTSSGLLTLNADGSFTYIPGENFSGTDTFTYLANDGLLDSNTAAVTIIVKAVADLPSLATEDATGDEATPIPLSISAALNDSDGSESISITIGGVPSDATLSAGTDNADGSWTLTPDELAGLTITVLDDADFDLSVTATATEASNGDRASSVTTISITVNNVVPMVHSIVGPSPSPGVPGQALTFSGSFTDPGTLDTHEVQWDFGDGTVIPFQPTTNDGALTPTHVYAGTGTFAVRLIVRDDDMGMSTETKDVAIQTVALQDDPLYAGQKALAVGGGSGDDHIVFTSGENAGQVQVILNGASQGFFEPTSRLLAFGQEGNDNIQVAGAIDLAAWLYGGMGNDRLHGGAGHDLLFGGLGDDALLGGSGRDMMVGGKGADRIVGNAGDDIMIAGTLGYADRDGALRAIMDEWTSARKYEARTKNLSEGVDGYFLRLGETVADDDDSDVLTGSSGLDWFFFDLNKDRATDRKDEAYANDLDWMLAP